MDTIKINSGRTLMVAHRGLSGIELENTLPAFVAAANRSYFGIETDVYKVKDGKYVLAHDGTTGRIADVNLTLVEHTYDELKNVTLLDRHDGRPRTDLHFCLMEEYVRVCKRYGKIGVLELKMNFSPEDLCEIIDIIKAEDYLDGIIFISFHFQTLAELRKILPEHPIQFLTGGEINKELIDALVENKMDLDVVHSSVTEDKVKLVHDSGLKINVWTVDSADRAKQLVEWGVDFITSNILE